MTNVEQSKEKTNGLNYEQNNKTEYVAQQQTTTTKLQAPDLGRLI